MLESIKYFILKSLICILLYPTVSHSDEYSFSKQDKLLLTNVGGIIAITGYGILNWDYFTRSPHAQSEGWFGRDTSEGGADKLGHFYTTYTLSHIFSNRLECWGYSTKKAAMWGTLTSLSLMQFMEFGDSFSEYGFAKEDFFMNCLGGLAGYISYRYPELSQKVDFRVEYVPDFSTADILTDYENTKYLAAIKLSGFEAIKSELLKNLEIHVGYYTRGYSSNSDNKSRTLYLGLGIIFSRILKKASWHKTSTFLNYYQPPFTYISIKNDLND